MSVSKSACMLPLRLASEREASWNGSGGHQMELFIIAVVLKC